VAPGWGKWTTPFAWPYVLMICVRIVPVLLAIAFLLPSTAAAAHRPNDDPATAACIREAAQRFQVPELALWVLLDVEAGKLGQVSTNTNGTYDIGPLPVNSWWLPKLAQFGITEDMVKNNLCINIGVGAWILAKELDRHKDIPRAIAYYHSPTPRHQRRYLGLVVGAIDRRLASRAKEPLAGNP